MPAIQDNTTLFYFLDQNYGSDGDIVLRQRLERGDDVNGAAGPLQETPLHVAARRRRAAAVDILLNFGADIDATTAGGKTAYAHAKRRGFDEIAGLLQARGANMNLNSADRFAVAVVSGELKEARSILEVDPEAIRTGNPEEDRLLADVSGRNDPKRVAFLIANGADLSAWGLDFATPLHQAAWFGQPGSARLLVRAGAPLNPVDPTHDMTPLGWAVHGSIFSGGAGGRQDAYTALVALLLQAGATPGDEKSAEALIDLTQQASPPIRDLLLDTSS